MTNDEIKQALEQMKISIAEIEKQLGIDINVEPTPAIVTGKQIGRAHV